MVNHAVSIPIANNVSITETPLQSTSPIRDSRLEDSKINIIETTKLMQDEEVERSIKNLENEMTISQSQLSNLEEDLVNRYLDLEASAGNYEVHEYEEVLNNLENERRELEEEKIKLQVN
jgi:hypothetical protein